MSYRLKRKRFRCGCCKNTYFALASDEETSKHCENCGKTGYEETKEEEELMPERKRQQLVDNAYRIVFNQENQQQFHTKTNVRDKSIDNFHGDAQNGNSLNGNIGGSNLIGPGMQSSQQQFRTPNPPKSTKMSQPGRPPSGYKPNNSNQNNTAAGSTLPRIDSRRNQRQPEVILQNNRRPPSGLNANRQQEAPQSRQQQQRQNVFAGPNMTNQSEYMRQSNSNPFNNTQHQQQPYQDPQNAGYPLRRESSSNILNQQQQPQNQERFNSAQRIFPQNSNNNQFIINNNNEQNQESQQRSSIHQNQSSNQSQNNRLRARSTTIRTSDGHVIQVVQFGLPQGARGVAQMNVNIQSSGPDLSHIEGMPDLENIPFPGIRRQGQASGAQNSNHIQFSHGHPQIILMRRHNNQNQNNRSGGIGGMGLGGGDELSEMLNSMLRDFQNMFSGHEFLRMNTIFQGFSPDNFMTNFNQNFFSDEAFMEMARRMSEQEQAAQAKKKKAKEESVKKLPIVKIEQKHCKKNQQGTFEAPTCTVCCENIAVGMKGMFMPCGHVYHPDCLNPWLQEHNTCPVCRYELPTESS